MKSDAGYILLFGIGVITLFLFAHIVVRIYLRKIGRGYKRLLEINKKVSSGLGFTDSDIEFIKDLYSGLSLGLIPKFGYLGYTELLLWHKDRIKYLEVLQEALMDYNNALALKDDEKVDWYIGVVSVSMHAFNSTRIVPLDKFDYPVIYVPVDPGKVMLKAYRGLPDFTFTVSCLIVIATIAAIFINFQ